MTEDHPFDVAMSDEQEQARDLARRVLGDLVTEERLRSAGSSATGWDAELWTALGAAGLLALAVPVALGGSGLSLLESAAVAIEAGRSLAPVPIANAIATATALAAAPDPRLRSWAEAVASGEAVVLTDLAALAPDRTPTLRLEPDGTVGGTVPWVVNAGQADRLVLVAEGDAGPAVVLLDPAHTGVRVVPSTLMSGQRVDELVVEGVPVDPDPLVGPEAAALVAGLRAQALVLSAAEAIGMAEGALALTALHVSEREQFGRPLGAFQAVALRAADCHIDVQAMTVTMWQAAYEVVVDADRAAAVEAVDVARIWACDGGHRVVSAALHLHGGIGVDLDYPLHRYLLRFKHLELLLGSGSSHLTALGRRIAARAHAEAGT